MKKEEYVNKLKLVEVSIDKVVKEIVDSAKEDDDISNYEEDELEDYIDGWLFDYQDVTSEERSELYEKLLPILKEIRNTSIENEREEEISQLSDRYLILEVIENNICYHADISGTVGYRLTSEEILDLILKNGTKNRS